MVRGKRTWRLESDCVVLGLAITSCVMLTASLVLFYSELNTDKFDQGKQVICDCDKEIDVVITWVNGSDLSFNRKLAKHYKEFQASRGVRGASTKEIDPKRFLDSEELRFCLRSIEKFAPWVRMVYIVTNGQQPHWLDTEHPQVKLVSHDRIFIDSSHLPTFSSPAIESNLHNIPGLSEHFLYLNDDIIFGQPVDKEDFISPDGTQSVWLSYPVPSFNEETDAYALSLMFVDELYTKVFGRPDTDGGERLVPAHGPLLVQKSVMEQLKREFSWQWKTTSGHKFRMADDMQYSFSYTHYLLEKRNEVTAMDIFTKTDTDKSDDLNMNELKELLINVNLQSNIKSSTKMLNLLVQEVNLCKSQTQSLVDILLMPFWWSLSKKQFFSCYKLLDLLKQIRGKKTFRAQVKKNDFLKFRMIESNVEKSVKTFENLGKYPSKFICINNDLNNKKIKKNKIVSGIQLQFYLDLFPIPSKFEKQDPFLQDSIHTKQKIKCSLSESERKIYCVENSGKRFDLNMTDRRPRPYWEDPDWKTLHEWDEFRNNMENKDKFEPNIAGFIEGPGERNLKQEQENNIKLSNKTVIENISNQYLGDKQISEINNFFEKIQKKRHKEKNIKNIDN